MLDESVDTCHVGMSSENSLPDSNQVLSNIMSRPKPIFDLPSRSESQSTSNGTKVACPSTDTTPKKTHSARPTNIPARQATPTISNKNSSIKQSFRQSRASLMLQAALSENRPKSSESSKSSYNPAFAQVTQRTFNFQRMDSVFNGPDHVTPPKRRKSNRVLFTDPVVTESFEYEPIPQIYSLIKSSKKLSHSTNQNNNNNSSISTEMVKENSSHEINTADACVGTSIENNSSNWCDSDISLTQDVSLDPDLDESSNVSTASSSDLRESNEGLFSSPKVSKIAPYRQQNMINNPELDSSPNKPTLKMDNSGSDGESSDSPILELDSDEEFSDCEAPKDQRNDAILLSEDCETRALTDSYFSWFTNGFTYITSKLALNKLI